MYTCDGCSGQGMLTDQIKTRPTKYVSRGSKPRQAKGGESRSRAAEGSETSVGVDRGGMQICCARIECQVTAF